MKIHYNENPTQKDLEFLENKLLEFNRTHVDHYGYERFCYTALDNAASIVAGIDCQVGGGWLYILSLWVERENRARGLGNKLLTASEQKAIEKGCHSAYLYTYSFQSPEFYKNNGYVTFGELEEFCGNRSKIFMKKRFSI